MLSGSRSAPRSTPSADTAGPSITVASRQVTLSRPPAASAASTQVLDRRVVAVSREDLLDIAFADQVGEPVAREQDAVSRPEVDHRDIARLATSPLTLRVTTLRHGW